MSTIALFLYCIGTVPAKCVANINCVGEGWATNWARVFIALAWPLVYTIVLLYYWVMFLVFVGKSFWDMIPRDWCRIRTKADLKLVKPKILITVNGRGFETDQTGFSYA